MEDESEVIDACIKLMREWKLGFLTTLDQSGTPQTRLTQPFPPELTSSNDIYVYIGTLTTTRKVSQLSHNTTATMGFHDPNGRGFVVLKGNATCLEDHDFTLRKKYWREDWTAFYSKEAPTSSDYTLIRFVPHTVEAVHYDLKINPGNNWRPFTLVKSPDESKWRRE